MCLTSISAPENHYVHAVAENKLGTRGALRGTFLIIVEEQSDSSIRHTLAQGWQTEWQGTMESQLLSVPSRVRILRVDYGSTPKNYQAEPIHTTFRYGIPDYALAGDDELLLKPMVVSNSYTSVLSSLRIGIDLETRRYSFRDTRSRLVGLDEAIILPWGYRLAGQSRSEQRTSPAANFEGSLR